MQVQEVRADKRLCGLCVGQAGHGQRAASGGSGIASGGSGLPALHVPTTPVAAGVVLPLMCMQAFLTSTHLGIAMEYAWWAACVCYLAALLDGGIPHLASKVLCRCCG